MWDSNICLSFFLQTQWSLLSVFYLTRLPYLVEIWNLAGICELQSCLGYGCFIILVQDMLSLPLQDFTLCMPKAQGQTDVDYCNSRLLGFIWVPPLSATMQIFPQPKTLGKHGTHFVNFLYLKYPSSALPSCLISERKFLIFCVILRVFRSVIFNPIAYSELKATFICLPFL